MCLALLHILGTGMFGYSVDGWYSLCRLFIKPFLYYQLNGGTSLAIPVLHQAAWRIICASPTKPYCLHFPHECSQMWSSSRSVKLLPGNKLCVSVTMLKTRRFDSAIVYMHILLPSLYSQYLYLFEM